MDDCWFGFGDRGRYVAFMNPIQFKLKALMLVVVTAAIGLAVYDHFYPFNQIRAGVTCSVSQAAEYRGNDSFRVDLESPFTGVLKCEYIDPRITYAPTDDPLFLNAAHVNSRSMGGRFEPRLELCDFSHKNESYSSVATLVDSLPTIEKLRTLTTVSQYVDLLGQQRGFSDGWTHGWLLFAIIDDNEIEVMSIFLHHGPGNNNDPELVFRHGMLKAISQ